MVRIVFIVGLLLLEQGAGAAWASTCSGTHPAIVSVAVKNVMSAGNLNRYEISGTVVNDGSSGQASSALQFVDISMDGEKLDAKSIPPLGAGQSHTFTYEYQRNANAGTGTTKLTFKLDLQNTTACSAANDRYVLTL